MRIDLHNHTRHSPDSKVEPADLVHRTRELGLDGLAITDHNTLAGVPAALEAARALPGLLVVPGMEVSTSEGHVLALGISGPIPRDLTAVETVERIVAVGGVAVAAHPHRFWSGLGEQATVSAKFAAYEVRNARTLRGANDRADLLAGRQGVGRTGGSDAHFLYEHGSAWTVFDGGPSSVDDVLQELGAGKTRAEGGHRGPTETVVYVTKAVSEWIGRGMRRI